MTGKTVRNFHGLILVLLLSCCLLFVFYGKVILSLNTTYFSLSGDGIQSYFNSTYLTKYDSSLFYSHSMNHPYGELSFYTQAQPLVMGPVKFISNHVTDITGSIVGIINFLMIFSIVLAAILLYLTLKEIGMPVVVSAVASVGIAFLSPQIDRMGGHFTLSFVWAIPLLIYFLMLFNKKPKLLYSILIGLALFVLITGHIYFAAFYFAILSIYWLFRVFYYPRTTIRKYLWMLGQFSVQFILPMLIFYTITGFYNDLVPDRPSKPFGFLIYKATPESVFLPIDMDYGRFLHKLINFTDVQWEGIAYTGLISAIGSLIILGIAVIRVLKRKWLSIFEITDIPYLNILFWTALLLLIYSFGIPFIFNMENLVDYLGPLKQLRALGRFAWLFFYVINIVVFYKLWQWQKIMPRRRFVMWLALALLFMDVIFFNKGNQDFMNNRYPEWTDTRNKLPENHWAVNFDVSKYQAIIPLPFYHMGSDNFNIPIRCNMLAQSYMVSAKTGLPVMAIYISRASVSQTAKNIALVQEPYREYEILKDLPIKKPFLLVAAKCDDYTSGENNLLRYSTPVDSNSAFTLYRLEYDSLASLPARKSVEVQKAINAMSPEQNILYKSIPLAEIALLDFNDSSDLVGYRGRSLGIKGRSIITLHNKALKNTKNTNYSVSFWLNPMNRDLVSKSRLLVTLFDTLGTQYSYLNVMCGDYVKTFDGSWGLVEYPFTVSDPDDRIRVTLYNELIDRNQSYQVDEIMIKPDSCQVFYKSPQYIMMNNRWYPTSDPSIP